MNVPLSSPDIGRRERELVNEVLDSNILSIGPRVEQFERMLADYLGVKEAVAVNSGTSGLHLAVRGLGICAGDEVITSPFSFVSSSNCILYEGARPVFVDIDPLTLNMDPEMIEKKISPGTKAILPVHVFGRPADMERIMEIARKHRLAVIEDACEAIGARYGEKMAGSESDAAVFAFYPNKQITTGEGGIISTNSSDLAGLCRSMRNQGRSGAGGWFNHCRLGYNYRLDELSAALGVAQMESIDEILAKREAVAMAYNAKLGRLAGVVLPYMEPGQRSAGLSTSYAWRRVLTGTGLWRTCRGTVWIAGRIFSQFTCSRFIRRNLVTARVIFRIQSLLLPQHWRCPFSTTLQKNRWITWLKR